MKVDLAVTVEVADPRCKQLAPAWSGVQQVHSARAHVHDVPHAHMFFKCATVVSGFPRGPTVVSK